MTYLDYQSTTPIDPSVVEIMIPYLEENYGNPSSVHKIGQKVRAKIEDGRETIADHLNCFPKEIFFTSGGTESNNLAIKGAMLANQKKGKHIVASRIEHPSVLEPCEYLENLGFKITYLPVDKYGLVSPQVVEEALREDTILVSIMHANHEIGTIQPIQEIGEILVNKDLYFHTDAVQTVGHIPVDLKRLQVDMLTFSSHKFYGPKGIGGLFVRSGTSITPQIHGGEQEGGKRAGTENVAGIVGMAKAIEIVNEDLDQEMKRETVLRNNLLAEIPERIEDTIVLGHPEERLPGSASFCFKGVDGESILLKLDMEGIICSTGSPCSSGSLKPSPVLLALGMSEKLAKGSLRLSLGRQSTEEEIDRVLEVLPPAVSSLRNISKI